LENWAGSYRYQATRVHRPAMLDELRELVSRSRKLKALGTRHSFNDIADAGADGELISLEHFTRVEEPDALRGTVDVGAGVTYAKLCDHLHRDGLALHNLASLPHIGVAGACATGTHGSGDALANVSSAVRAMQVVTADGAVHDLSRELDGERFNGMVVALGGLGVVTRLTLDVVPAFDVRQDVYEGLAFEQLGEHFDEITASADSVSLFTDWRGPRFTQVWLKRRVRDDSRDPAAPRFFGATRAPADRHPIAGLPPGNCTPQMGLPGPWHERLPHFRADHTPSSGKELQSEYFVPRPRAVEALRAVYGLREHVAPLLQISEVRTIAADELWMSPCYRRASASIHFTWKKEQAAVRALLPRIEAALEPFGARPHWGKLFALPPARLRSLYPRLDDFGEMLRAHDPTGKFRNAFLKRYVFPVA
jgi:xylitol oxidase